MNRGEIRLDPKHGVNPSIGVCFYCQEDDGTVVLPGMLKGGGEAPHRAVWTKEPCPTCKGHMAHGVILIAVRDGESGENPYRTGPWVVISENWVNRVVKPPMRESLLSRRVAFIEDAVWAQLGLPRGAAHEKPMGQTEGGAKAGGEGTSPSEPEASPQA